MRIDPSIKVYLIYRSKGSWDDYHSWVCAVFTSKPLAEKYCIKKNDQINRIKSYYLPDEWNNDEWNDLEESSNDEIDLYIKYSSISNLNADFTISETRTRHKV